MERLPKVATPATAAAVAVPESVPPPALLAMAAVTFAVDAVWLPYWSLIRTFTAGAMETPATALLGCTEKASAAGTSGMMLNALDVEVVSAGEVATSV